MAAKREKKQDVLYRAYAENEKLISAVIAHNLIMASVRVQSAYGMLCDLKMGYNGWLKNSKVKLEEIEAAEKNHMIMVESFAVKLWQVLYDTDTLNMMRNYAKEFKKKEDEGNPQEQYAGKVALAMHKMISIWDDTYAWSRTWGFDIRTLENGEACAIFMDSIMGRIISVKSPNSRHRRLVAAMDEIFSKAGIHTWHMLVK